MAHLIDKSALVAEIDKRIADNKKDIQRATHKHLEEYFEGYEDALVLFKEKFLDTLEVKEVDFDKESDNYWAALTSDVRHHIYYNDYYKIAKHFFELGLQASNTQTWKDINLIDHLLFDIKEDYDNGKLDKEKYYKEVLKKFKAQL